MMNYHYEAAPTAMSKITAGTASAAATDASSHLILECARCSCCCSCSYSSSYFYCCCYFYDDDND